MKLWLVLALPLFILDQVTKAIIVRTMAPGDAIPVVPYFFDIVRWHNTGAAFGMLRDNNMFFIILASVALVVLFVMTRRGAFNDRVTAVAVALLASGIAGNLTDRWIHGYVVDFLSFDLHIPFANPWPAFNVADSCICIAAGLFVWASVFGHAATARSAANGK